MGMWIGRNRKARVTYGFDEIALVPGRVTINPNEVDITFRLPRKEAEPLELKIPILASAMDGVVDVRFAIAMSKLGGLAVLNLEGVQTRYKNPQEVLQKIVEADKSEVTALLQKIYQEPVQEDLIAARIRQIKDGGALAAVSSIPQRAAEFGEDRAGSRAPTFSSCKAPSRPSAIFPRNINRSIWKNSAAKCASRSSSATRSATTSRSRSWNAGRRRS